MAHSGGGGSHGGGSHGGSHHSGGSGGGVTTSKKYFRGAYYHSYVDRRGRFRTYYSSQAKVTRPMKRGIIVMSIFMIPFLTLWLIISIFAAVQVPSKMKGTVPDEVRVVDTLDCFTDEQEQSLSETLAQYYDQTGLNAVVYTLPKAEWEPHYTSLETYSMEKYYQLFSDEEHYLVVFSNEMLEDGWQDWSFETIVGDDTSRVLGTVKENYMTERLQSNLWSFENDPQFGIDMAFKELMEYSKTTHVDWYNLLVSIFMVGIFGMVFGIWIHTYRKQKDEYEYVLEHPEAIKNPEDYHLQCPSCSAPNTNLEDSCAYCGSVLRKR